MDEAHLNQCTTNPHASPFLVNTEPSNAVKCMAEFHSSDSLGSKTSLIAKPVDFTLITRNRHDDLTPTSFHVALEVKNLLPCAQDQSTVPNRNGEVGPESRSLQMRMSIAVVPSLLVFILTIGWQWFIENFG